MLIRGAKTKKKLTTSYNNLLLVSSSKLLIFYYFSLSLSLSLSLLSSLAQIAKAVMFYSKSGFKKLNSSLHCTGIYLCLRLDSICLALVVAILGVGLQRRPKCWACVWQLTIMKFLGVCSYGFVFNMVVGLGYVVVVLGRGFLIWWVVALRTMMMVVVDFGWQW